jgi:hypothetical protein
MPRWSCLIRLLPAPSHLRSSASCAHIMRPAEQRRCAHASLSCTNTVGSHENKPRQSKQLVHAAIASVVLNSAIASAVTPANPAAALHTPYAPPSSIAAPTHHNRVQIPKPRTKTSRGRAKFSCSRQMPRWSCLNSAIASAVTPVNPAALCTHHTPRHAVPVHGRHYFFSVGTFRHCLRSYGSQSTAGGEWSFTLV